MGEFLSTPNKEKHSEDSDNSLVTKFEINPILATLWSQWNAGMEKKNGGFTYNRYQHWCR
jgi:hypothetical protein